MKTRSEPARQIPVIAEVDVAVAGGGPGGIVAAIAAARSGARTILVEQYGFLGGTATAGLMTCINGFRNQRPPNSLQTVKGIPAEIMLKAHALGGTSIRHWYEMEPFDMDNGVLPYAIGIDPEILKYVLMVMAQEAGVQLLLHTYAVAPLTQGNTVEGIIVENKSGRQAIEAKVVVDGTGDGDLAAAAGAPFALETDTPTFMTASLMFRMANIDLERVKNPYGIPLPGGTVVMWGARLPVNGVDAADLTRAEIAAREQTWQMVEDLKKQPGYENAWLIDTATTLGVRETRRFIGEYIVTEQDAIDGRRFDDVIAISSNPVPRYYGERYFFQHEGFDIPYRSLVPLKVDHLLLSGRIISAEQMPFQAARSMASAMAVAEAAGTAAALCTKQGVTPRRLEVKALQDQLLAQGAELGMSLRQPLPPAR